MIQRNLIPWLAILFLVSSCASSSHHYWDSPQRQLVKAPAAKRPDAPSLKKNAKGRYKLRKPWTVAVGGKVWHIPAGYSCNGITAPDRMKASLGDGIDHPETWAAIFHDWLFTQKGVSRAQADAAFHELLLAYGVPPRKAAMMHGVVSAYSFSKRFR